MGMKSVPSICFCVLLLGATVFAQSRPRTGGPEAAVSSPSFEASLGYVYDRMSGPPSQWIGLNGINADGLVKFTSRWGATVDASFARAGNAFATGHSANVLSGLAGPVFYPMGRRRTEV